MLDGVQFPVSSVSLSKNNVQHNNENVNNLI